MDNLQFDFSRQQQKRKETNRVKVPPAKFQQYLLETVPPGWDVSAKHIKLICDQGAFSGIQLYGCQPSIRRSFAGKPVALCFFWTEKSIGRKNYWKFNPMGYS